jgi:hypothetical protein
MRWPSIKLMYRLPLVRLLLSPSLCSLVMTLVAAVTAIAVNIWPIVRHSAFLETNWFGQYGAKTLLIQAPDRLALVRLMLHGTLVYYLIVVTVGVTLGLIVYAVLQTIGRARSDAQEFVAGLREQRQNVQTVRRLEVRIFALLAWAVYVLFFVNVLVPFALAMAETAVSDTGLGAAILYLLGALVALLVGLHIHVVFMRLVLLRLRVFGGDDLVAEYDH